MITLNASQVAVIKIKLSLRFNWAPRHGGVLGSGSIAPCILYLGTRWRWVVSFTPWPLYPQGKSRWYSLDMRLGGSQSRSGRGCEEKNYKSQPGLDPPIIQPAAQPCTPEVSRLPECWKPHEIRGSVYALESYHCTENFVWQVLQFENQGVCRELPFWAGIIITDLKTNCRNTRICCSFHGLGLVTCSGSELTSELWIPLDIWIGFLGWGIGHRKGSTYTVQHNTEKSGHVHALIGTWTHDPNIQTVQNHTSLRSHGHWDRHYKNTTLENVLNSRK
jgi:hypothetical protein